MEDTYRRMGETVLYQSGVFFDAGKPSLILFNQRANEISLPSLVQMLLYKTERPYALLESIR